MALRRFAQIRSASEERKEKLCLHSDNVKMCKNKFTKISFCCFPVCLQKYFYLCFDSGLLSWWLKFARFIGRPFRRFYVTDYLACNWISQTNSLTLWFWCCACNQILSYAALWSFFPSLSHLLAALIQLLAAFHIDCSAVGVGQIGSPSCSHGSCCCSNVVGCGACGPVLSATPTVFSRNHSAPSHWELAIYDHLHAAFVGCQIPFSLDNDAMALVGSVTLAHVFVEEQAPVSDPSQDDADREEEQGDQGLPHLKHTWTL